MDAQPRGGTLLLVEDDGGLRRVFSRMLERKGYLVLAVATPEEALEKCRTPVPIALLLTDVQMPGMSGFELAKKATELRPGLPIVFMSGFTDDTLQDAQVSVGAEILFLQKPFDTEALLSKVREALGMPR